MAELIDADAPGVLKQASLVLEAGGTLVFPTDTVYALAARPSSTAAVSRIFELKRRPADMHLIVLVADPSHVHDLSADRRAGTQALMRSFWPGAVTLVLPEAHAEFAHLGADDGSIGVRSPDHGFANALAALTGPVATTSANLHGCPTPSTAEEIAAVLPEVDLVVDGGPLNHGIPSTVVDLTGPSPEILREGRVVMGEIMKVWSSATR